VLFITVVGGSLITPPTEESRNYKIERRATSSNPQYQWNNGWQEIGRFLKETKRDIEFNALMKLAQNDLLWEYRKVDENNSFVHTKKMPAANFSPRA